MKPMLARSRPLFCRVVALIDATFDIRIVRLAVVHGGAFRFAAGQYARVAFAEHKPRELAMASRPEEADLEFHVAHRADAGANQDAARTLRVGDGAWVDGPYGDAWLRRDYGGPILCAACGSGLGAMKSIVETALGCGLRQDIELIFGGRSEGDIYLEEHFRDLERRHPNFRYTVVVAKPAGPGRERGTVVDMLAARCAARWGAAGESKTASGLTSSAPAGGPVGAKAYLAGPAAMIDGARTALLGLGMRAVDIHADPIYPASEPVAAASGRRARSFRP